MNKQTIIDKRVVDWTENEHINYAKDAMYKKFGVFGNKKDFVECLYKYSGFEIGINCATALVGRLHFDNECNEVLLLELENKIPHTDIEFRLGDKVTHKIFGDGEVISNDFHYLGKIAKVRFNDKKVGEKNILVDFLKIK